MTQNTILNMAGSLFKRYKCIALSNLNLSLHTTAFYNSKLFIPIFSYPKTAEKNRSLLKIYWSKR